MSATPSATIPYEKQADPSTNRMCGAAALSMVYRSLDKATPQAEIWSKIAKPNRLGSLTAATHLIARDALSRGFAALAIQAKHPLQALRICLDNNIRAILNHRLAADAATGHFTVLVDLTSDAVVLHDPYLGPARRLSHAELLELWDPRYRNAEIVGNMLIGIAAQPPAVPACKLCGTTMLAGIACPKCGKPVPLQPAPLLGCLGFGCISRMWNYVCCPSCDFTWCFGLNAPPTNGPPIPPDGFVDLKPLFGELDKFIAQVLSMPGAADPDVRKQLDFIKASKDQLRLVQSEEVARRKTLEARLAQFQQKSKQDEEAILKKKAELTKPAPPLDGNALGLALVKELGLLGEESAPRKPGPPTPPPPPPPPRVAAQERKRKAPVEQVAPAAGKPGKDTEEWDTLEVPKEGDS